MSSAKKGTCESQESVRTLDCEEKKQPSPIVKGRGYGVSEGKTLNSVEYELNHPGFFLGHRLLKNHEVDLLGGKRAFIRTSSRTSWRGEFTKAEEMRLFSRLRLMETVT